MFCFVVVVKILARASKNLNYCSDKAVIKILIVEPCIKNPYS